MASDPNFFAGAITAQTADKMVRFIDICDTFHLPMVSFVDILGFMIGTDAEKQGTIRFGARFIFAVYQATIPWCSIILRKVFGVAGPWKPLPPEFTLCLAFRRMGIASYRRGRSGSLSAPD